MELMETTSIDWIASRYSIPPLKPLEFDRQARETLSGSEEVDKSYSAKRITNSPRK